MKMRVFVCDAAVEMQTISYEQPGRKRFQTEAEREKHRQSMRAAMERRQAAMLIEKDFAPKDHKARRIIPDKKVILSQIRQGWF